MRIFMRIVFALFVAMGLGLVIVQANAKAFEQKVDELGKIAIEQNNFSFFISERYYEPTPLIDDVFLVDQTTYRLFIYHVATVRYVGLNPEIYQGFQVFLQHLSGPSIIVPFQGTIKTIDDAHNLTFYAFQIGNLPIYAMLDMEHDSSFYNEIDLMIDNEFKSVTAFEISKNKEVLGSYPLSISQEDFVLEDRLNEFINLNGTVPTKSVSGIFMTEEFSYDSSFLVVRDSIIYLLIVALAFYGFFIYKKKRLGRRDATEGLKKDIEKLKELPQEKR
jgi:hypothetical protein